MSLVKPFRGLRPPPELVKAIAAPPYDVVSESEARALARGNAQSFFHVSRPEIDLPEGTDEHAAAVYAKGAENLRTFQERGWLKQDGAPRFYAYRQKMGSHVQTGLVALASVDEYDAGLIKKHELTRADKEDDRTHHIEVLGANDEPVFLTYRAAYYVDELMAEVALSRPVYDFQSDDGIQHTFWVVPDELAPKLEDAFRRDVAVLYIADGHHRSAAASRVRKLYQQRGKGSGSHDWFLAVIFPDDQMQILDYNRLVKDLNGLSEEQFLEKLGARFRVERTPAASPRKKPAAAHHFGMYLGKTWYQLVAKPDSFEETPTGVLDVTILQRNVLQSILGIGDPRTDPRMAFVGGSRGVGELEKRVDSGEFQVAFAMHPTTLAQLIAIADAGEIMPPKSTWFEPKLRSGLVVHLFEPTPG